VQSGARWGYEGIAGTNKNNKAKAKPSSTSSMIKNVRPPLKVRRGYLLKRFSTRRFLEDSQVVAKTANCFEIILGHDVLIRKK
jgi:hypothetical protein